MNTSDWAGPLYRFYSILILSSKASYLIKELVSHNHLWNQVSAVEKDEKQFLMDKLAFFSKVSFQQKTSHFLQNNLCW